MPEKQGQQGQPQTKNRRPEAHPRRPTLRQGRAVSGSFVNPDVHYEDEARERAEAGRRVAAVTEDLGTLGDEFSGEPVDHGSSWDPRFQPAGLREETQTPAQDIWDRRLMPERLRRLVAEGDIPHEMPTGPIKIITAEDIERAKKGLPPIEDPDGEVPTIVDFEPAFPGGGEPPADGGDGGDGDDFSHLPPPPVVTPDIVPSKDRLNRALLTGSYSLMGAMASMSAMAWGTMAVGGATNSSVLVAGMAAGAAVPHAARIVRGATPTRLSAEWKGFQQQTGWGARQCRRWESAGFTPEQAQQWDSEFRTRPGMRPDSYPPGGDRSTVKQAKEFRDMGGAGAVRITPEEARPFIHAYMTPKNILEWHEKYLPDNPATEHRAELRRFMLAAHTSLSLKTGYGYKDVDSAMKTMCKDLGIPRLRRYDKSDDGLLESYNRTMGSSRAALADSIW